MYENVKREVRDFISKNIEYSYILYLEGIKMEENYDCRLNLYIYYVDNDMKLDVYNTKIYLTYDILTHIRKYYKNQIDNDRIHFLSSIGYDTFNIFSGFNSSFTSFINKNKDLFIKKVDANIFADNFASIHGITNRYHSSVRNLIFEGGIDCDFRNYSDCDAGFDTIEVDIPLIRRGRDDESQRKEIMKLRNSLKKIAIDYIKKDPLYDKYKVPLDSLYVSNLYHTHDDILQFIFKVK